MKHSAVSIPTSTTLLLAALSSGCSFVFVQGPPVPEARDIYVERGAAPDCTSSMTVPVIDGISASLFLASGLQRLARDDAVGSFSVTEFATAGVLGWSAIRGRQKVRSCREFLSSLVVPSVPDTIPEPGMSNP